MELRTTTAGNCIVNDSASLVLFSNIRFGVCAGNHLWSLQKPATLRAVGNYAIVGNMATHCRATFGVVEILSSNGIGTVTLSGTPTFSYFVWSIGGNVSVESVTFSGSGSGQRWVYNLGGGVYSNVTLPGTSDGPSSSYPSGFKV